MRDTVLPDTLLIAEDDPLLLPLLKATFRTSGLRVLTAHAGLADQWLADEAGADAYLTKPFSPVAFLDAVRAPEQTETTT